MAEFITEDFLLENDTAKALYHRYAEPMPIYDYHCHLLAKEIADDKNFENLTQAWLYGDHYKWRAMRANGIDEKFITGQSDDFEKFLVWAQTVPYTLRNPLYHWTHLELKRYFGINELLNSNSAKRIYNQCSEMLNTPDFSVRNLLQKMNVKLLCTTEDPLDDLEYHKKIKQDYFEIKVHTAWRPDKSLAAENPDTLNTWIDDLAEITNIDINDYKTYLDAIRKRHDYFHANGCRLSDRGLELTCAQDYTTAEIETIFQKIRSRHQLSVENIAKFKSAMLFELAIMDYNKGWVQQLHLGALRNTNTKMFKAIGPDTGFDSIADNNLAKPLAMFLDKLNSADKLPKTIIYNLNPSDNEVIAAMTGNFQDGSVPGKIQFGSGWWFLDQKDGIEKQLNTLSNTGLLRRFVGMLTDSRSFLSYPRHEYFRRILCNLLGNDVEKGLLPADMDLLGAMVSEICYKNAENYFDMEI